MREVAPAEQVTPRHPCRAWCAGEGPMVNEQTQRPCRSRGGRPGGLPGACPLLRILFCFSKPCHVGAQSTPGSRSLTGGQWDPHCPPHPLHLGSRAGRAPATREPHPLSAASPGARLTRGDQPCCGEDARGTARSVWLSSHTQALPPDRGQASSQSVFRPRVLPRDLEP